jgi:hypothetical protein
MVHLRDPQGHADAMRLKRQLDAAVAALEMCQRFQIRPEGRVTVLPNLQTMTPACSYRVCEDNETDNPAEWIELRIDGERLELSPGDIVIEQRG